MGSRTVRCSPLPGLASGAWLRMLFSQEGVVRGDVGDVARERLPDVDRWPFDLARVHLAYAEHLRRHHAPRAAKPHLDTALAVFERLGARPWMARADNELRTSGRTRRHHDDVLAGALTPQEREIGLMAASGMSNKQIGEHLFLSPRTVATHLYRAFPSSASPHGQRCATP